jgi:hypothetical protein
MPWHRCGFPRGCGSRPSNELPENRPLPCSLRAGSAVGRCELHRRAGALHVAVPALDPAWSTPGRAPHREHRGGHAELRIGGGAGPFRFCALPSHHPARGHLCCGACADWSVLVSWWRANRKIESKPHSDHESVWMG